MTKEELKKDMTELLSHMTEASVILKKFSKFSDAEDEQVDILIDSDEELKELHAKLDEIFMSIG